jgi:hypothetical protein
MRRLLVVLSLIVLSVGAAAARQPALPGEMGVSFGVFYSSLDRYGEWLSVDGGVYAWHPTHIGRDWRPYWNGQWMWTDDGWYWSSDEPWAWAVYHYGRWYYDDYYGWVWIPGYDWAPAWVEWRYSGDVIGWAPLGPYAVFDLRFGISYHRAWVTPIGYWSFVGLRHFCSPGVSRYIYGHNENRRYFGVTRAIGALRSEGGRIIDRGPNRSLIERRTGSRIRPGRIVTVRNAGDARILRRGTSEEIRVYRPLGETRGSAPARPSNLRQDNRRLPFDFPSSDLGRRSIRGADRSGERSQSPAAPAFRSRNTPRPQAPGREPLVRRSERRSPSPERQVRPREDRRRVDRQARPGAERRHEGSSPSAKRGEERQHERRR